MKTPKSLGLVHARWMKEGREPDPRKKIEVAILLRATDKEAAAQELESLADHLRKGGRDGFIGFVGHGCGYHATTCYTAFNLKEVTCPDA